MPPRSTSEYFIAQVFIGLHLKRPVSPYKTGQFAPDPVSTLELGIDLPILLRLSERVTAGDVIYRALQEWCSDPNAPPEANRATLLPSPFLEDYALCIADATGKGSLASVILLESVVRKHPGVKMPYMFSIQHRRQSTVPREIAVIVRTQCGVDVNEFVFGGFAAAQEGKKSLQAGSPTGASAPSMPDAATLVQLLSGVTMAGKTVRQKTRFAFVPENLNVSRSPGRDSLSPDRKLGSPKAIALAENIMEGVGLTQLDLARYGFGATAESARDACREAAMLLSREELARRREENTRQHERKCLEREKQQMDHAMERTDSMRHLMLRQMAEDRKRKEVSSLQNVKEMDEWRRNQLLRQNRLREMIEVHRRQTEEEQAQANVRQRAVEPSLAEELAQKTVERKKIFLKHLRGKASQAEEAAKLGPLMAHMNALRPQLKRPEAEVRQEAILQKLIGSLDGDCTETCLQREEALHVAAHLRATELEKRSENERVREVDTLVFADKTENRLSRNEHERKSR